MLSGFLKLFCEIIIQNHYVEAIHNTALQCLLTTQSHSSQSGDVTCPNEV